MTPQLLGVLLIAIPREIPHFVVEKIIRTLAMLERAGIKQHRTDILIRTAANQLIDHFSSDAGTAVSREKRDVVDHKHTRLGFEQTWQRLAEFIPVRLPDLLINGTGTRIQIPYLPKSRIRRQIDIEDVVGLKLSRHLPIPFDRPIDLQQAAFLTRIALFALVQALNFPLNFHNFSIYIAKLGRWKSEPLLGSEARGTDTPRKA